jgi:vancomycin aglycone glucosyltransferase
MKKEIIAQVDKLPAIVAGSDLLIGVGLVHGVPTVAEKLKIRYRFMAFYPGIMGPPKDVAFPGRLLWGFGMWATNASLRGVINQKRKEIGLAPIADVWTNWMGDNVILASEKSLIPVSENIDYHFTQTGHLFLPSLTPLSSEVERFLEASDPPVFIGFGSNPIQNPEKYGRMIAGVAAATGRRLIVSKGWGAIESPDNDQNCLFVDEVPYELLFPRVAMVIHHGGIGTLAAAAKAGVPQAAFPFMADQFQNQKEMIRMGISPKTVAFKKLSISQLVRVIGEGLINTRYREKALEISGEIKGHNATLETVELVERLCSV